MSFTSREEREPEPTPDDPGPESRDRYAAARDLAGGEDPLECLKAITETKGFIDGEPATLSAWVNFTIGRLQGQLAAEQRALLTVAEAVGYDTEEAEGESLADYVADAFEGLREALRLEREQRVKVGAMVQELLNHSPGGREPWPTPYNNVDWLKLRERARALLANPPRSDTGEAMVEWRPWLQLHWELHTTTVYSGAWFADRKRAEEVRAEFVADGKAAVEQGQAKIFSTWLERRTVSAPQRVKEEK